jgi:hypothetical protein
MEEEKKDENIDLQQEAKEIVLNELEKTGLISNMRAMIKKSILEILEKQNDNTKQKLEFDYMTPLNRLNKNKELILACQLIKEFLKFYEMEYTFPIFENESNIKENIQKETLLKEFKLQENKDDPKPVLLQLVMERLNNPFNNNNADRYSGTFANYSNVYNNPNKLDDNNSYNNPVVPNKKLSPINFTNTNKSVEMNDDPSSKFSNINISDVYKRDKEITAADILNKNNNNNKDINNNNKDPILSGNEKVDGGFTLENKLSKSDKYDEEFNEVILEEDIDKDKDKKNNNQEESISASASKSYGYDSSVQNFNVKEFDYIEDVEKP